MTLNKVGIDLHKVEAILEWPLPATLKQLMGFLSLSIYYRKFVKLKVIVEFPSKLPYLVLFLFMKRDN